MFSLWEILKVVKGCPPRGGTAALAARLLGSGGSSAALPNYITADGRTFCTNSGLKYGLKER